MRWTIALQIGSSLLHASHLQNTAALNGAYLGLDDQIGSATKNWEMDLQLVW